MPDRASQNQMAPAAAPAVTPAPAPAVTPAATPAARPILSGPRLTTILSLVIGVFGAAWILLHSPDAPAWLARSGAEGVVAARNYGDKTREQLALRRMEGPDGFRAPIPPPVALYTANLTDRTGDYIVSVRRTRVLNYNWDDNPPLDYVPAQTAPIYLSLQVMSSRPGALSHIDSLGKGLTVTDSDGQLLRPERIQEFAFPDGRGVRLRLPPSKAAFLRSVDGALTLRSSFMSHSAGPRVTSSPVPATLPFHIANVPLPWSSHVYGLAGAAIVDRQTAATLGLPTALAASVPLLLDHRLLNGIFRNNLFWSNILLNDCLLDTSANKLFRLIAGAKVNDALRLLPRTALNAPDLPLVNRLMLQPDAPGAVALGLASGIPGADRALCDITVHAATDGEIVTTLRFQARSGLLLSQTFSLWDDRPALVAVPARLLNHALPQEAWAIVYLHLFTDNGARPAPQASPTPRRFVAASNVRGSVLSGRITANDEGVGPGAATVSLLRLTKGGMADGVAEQVTLNVSEEGRFTLPNIAPGRYRATLLDARPDVGRLSRPRDFAAYLKHRWRIASALPQRATQDADIGPGEYHALPDWTFRTPAPSPPVSLIPTYSGLPCSGLPRSAP